MFHHVLTGLFWVWLLSCLCQKHQETKARSTQRLSAIIYQTAESQFKGRRGSDPKINSARANKSKIHNPKVGHIMNWKQGLIYIREANKTKVQLIRADNQRGGKRTKTERAKCNNFQNKTGSNKLEQDKTEDSKYKCKPSPQIHCVGNKRHITHEVNKKINKNSKHKKQAIKTESRTGSNHEYKVLLRCKWCWTTERMHEMQLSSHRRNEFKRSFCRIY